MPRLKLEYRSLRLQIRPLEFSDADDIYKHARFREVSKWTTNIPYPYPKDGAKAFIKESKKKLKDCTDYYFSIVLREKNEVIGIISLSYFDQNDQHATLGYWLSKDYWGKGIMTEATKLMLEFAFMGLKLHKVKSNVFAPNTASMNVLKKSGFKKEGVARDETYKYREWLDVHYFGLLKNEWNKQ
ncbi:MAG: GNAT family N-acetyltransferase [Candidatus Altiarchaeota archaeon]|nr:GNAT family N-acetyltransferase [Candidatus Altiarchaeota archaeon]